MQPRTCRLKDGRQLLFRQAVAGDATMVLQYLEVVCAESDFLTFGPGQFDLTRADEEDFLQRCHDTDNHLYLLGLINGQLVGTLSFTAGQRPRVRHTGELGMTVCKSEWGRGIGGSMLDQLIDWARQTKLIRKLNLRVRIDNQRAIQLYRSRGFVVEGTITREIILDGEYYDHHWMGLQL